MPRPYVGGPAFFNQDDPWRAPYVQDYAYPIGGGQSRDLGAQEQIEQLKNDLYGQFSNMTGEWWKYLMAPPQVQPWQPPMDLWNLMGGTIAGMQGLPSTQQGGQNWLNAFGPMMQAGQQINWADPAMQQTAMNPVVQEFLNRRAGQDVYGAPAMGVGGQTVADILSGKLGGVTGPGGDAEARQQWYNALLGLLNQPGMAPGEMAAARGGIMAPVESQLARQQAQAMSDLERRGLGRSTAPVTLAGDIGRSLSEAEQATLSDLTQQDIALRNANRLAGVSGLGDYNRWLSQYGLAGTEQLGQLGLGLEQMNQAAQQWRDQMNMAAREQAFGELQGQAQLGAGLYESDADRALRELQSARDYQMQQQQLMQGERGMADQNLLNLLGMGATGSVNDMAMQQNLLNSLLGVGGLSQDAWKTQQQLGLQGILSNQQLFAPLIQSAIMDMYGSQVGQEQFLQNLGESQRQFGQNMGLQRQLIEMQQPHWYDYLLRSLGSAAEVLPFILKQSPGTASTTYGGPPGYSPFGGDVSRNSWFANPMLPYYG